MREDELNELNAIIQSMAAKCDCGKIDAYKGDGHDCNEEIARQQKRDMSENK